MGIALRLGRRLEALLGLTEQRCAICHIPVMSPGVRPPVLCSLCQQQLPPYRQRRCRRCGFPMRGAVPCLACLETPPPWDGLHFYGLYDGVLRELLLRFKFGGELGLVPLLGTLLLRACAAVSAVDMVTGIPLGWRRLRKRGYNQALELARWLAAVARIPLRFDCLLRRREVPPQEQLSFAERQENPRDSFCARHVRDQRILLVDDVMTTGATLRYAAYCLRTAGAREIHVAFVARTPFRGDVLRGWL